MRSLIALFIGLFVANAQFFNSANNAQPACLVTGNKLFSHGYYIRDLQENEFAQITKYREEIADFQKKLNDAFSPTNFLTNSTSVPIMPIRPNLPSFCTGNDTTLYILGACTLQNNKIYVSGKFARELSEDEKVKLTAFVNQLSNNNYNTTPSTDSDSNTTMSNSTEIPQQKIVLDFCQEF